MTDPSHDPEEEILKEYEKENQWFYQHWVWKKIGISPQDLFKKLENIKSQIPLDKKEWGQLLKQAEEKHKKLVKNKKSNLKLSKVTNGLKG